MPTVAKSDYAINGGDFVMPPYDGPTTLAEGDDPAYPWLWGSIDQRWANGVGYLRNEVRLSDITDGTSNTYLVGEKRVAVSGYRTDADRGYDHSLFSGGCWDSNRFTDRPPQVDGDLSVNGGWESVFGSAHSTVCHFVFCDGSVRPVSFNIDAHVHRYLGRRNDGHSLSIDW